MFKWYLGVWKVMLSSPRVLYESATGVFVDGICPNLATSTRATKMRRTRTTTTTTTTVKEDERFDYEDEEDSEMEQRGLE